MPEVSVVLPCYNAVEFLPQALDSVRAQTFSDYEIIVVDDGSTDRATLDYLNALPDDVRVVRQPNKGLPGARNTGFREAAGTYVLPLDCDDFIAPRCLEELLKALKEKGDGCYVFSNIVLRGQKTGTLKRNFNFFEQLFLNHVPYSIMIAKDLWCAVGGYDERMCEGLEDWELNIRLGAAGHYGHLVDKPLFYYTVRDSGMLQSMTNRRHGQLTGYIRRAHRNLYTPKSVLRIWRKWRDKPNTYPFITYFFLYFMYMCLPVWLFNPLFRFLLNFSTSGQMQNNADPRPS